MQEEIWKDIAGYEGLYSVSNYGRVRSFDRASTPRIGFVAYKVKGRILRYLLRGAGKKRRDGSYAVALCRDGKRHERFVHHLVLETFVGPRLHGMETRHFPDRDRKNNAVWNLRWGTSLENAADKVIHGTKLFGEKGGNARLKDEDVLSIYRLTADGVSRAAIGRQYRVPASHISNIVNGVRWKHLYHLAV